MVPILEASKELTGIVKVWLRQWVLEIEPGMRISVSLQ
jgi:hypothetical protein